MLTTCVTINTRNVSANVTALKSRTRDYEAIPQLTLGEGLAHVYNVAEDSIIRNQ
jgi:hypothetical protein